MHADWKVELLMSLIGTIPYLLVIVPVAVIAGIVWLVRRRK